MLQDQLQKDLAQTVLNSGVKCNQCMELVQNGQNYQFATNQLENRNMVNIKTVAEEQPLQNSYYINVNKKLLEERDQLLEELNKLKSQQEFTITEQKNLLSLELQQLHQTEMNSQKAYYEDLIAQQSKEIKVQVQKIIELDQQNQDYSIAQQNLTTKIENQKVQISQLQNQLFKNNEQIDHIQIIEKELNQMQEEWQTKYNKEVAKLNQEIISQSLTIQDYDSKFKQIKSEVEGLKELLQSKQQQIQDLLKKNSELQLSSSSKIVIKEIRNENLIKSMQDKIAYLEKEIEQQNIIIKQNQKPIREEIVVEKPIFIDRVAKYEKHYQTFSSHLDYHQNKVAKQLNQQVGTIQNRQESQVQSVDQKVSRQNNSDFIERISELKTQNSRLTSENQSFKDQLDKLIIENSGLQDKNKNLQQQITKLKSENQSLTEKYNNQADIYGIKLKTLEDKIYGLQETNNQQVANTRIIVTTAQKTEEENKPTQPQ